MSEDHEQFPMDTAGTGYYACRPIFMRWWSWTGVRPFRNMCTGTSNGHPTIFRAFRFPRFESRQDRAFSTRDILFVILLDRCLHGHYSSTTLHRAHRLIFYQLARPPPFCAASADTRTVDSWQNTLFGTWARVTLREKMFRAKIVARFETVVEWERTLFAHRVLFRRQFFFLYFSVLFVFVTYDYFYDRPFPVVINVLNQRVKMFRTLHIFSDSFGRYYWNIFADTSRSFRINPIDAVEIDFI